VCPGFIRLAHHCPQCVGEYQCASDKFNEHISIFDQEESLLEVRGKNLQSLCSPCCVDILH